MKKKKTNLTKKASKHLKKNWIKYGFETLVVIIGILLALALNNWNENRLQNIHETQYLNGLITDLKVDTTYYDERITRAEYIMKANREIIHEMYQTQHNLEEVNALFNKAGWDSEQLTTRNTTYIELKSSGNINIIKNQGLKDAIINYYRRNEEATKHVSEFNEVSSRYLIDMGMAINDMKFYDFNDDIYNGVSIVTNDDWVFMNESTSKKFQLLEQSLAIYKIKHQIFSEQHFKPLKEMATQLINDIQKELDSRN